LLVRDGCRSVQIDLEKDTFLRVNRIYLDITDVKYAQADNVLGPIFEFLAYRLRFNP
ncbi:MAG: hypothetical protein HKM93_05980, partial [Desulfobacteraceae bacterium]|nr:hypothetical protein [Desulfobacteraceae bacterium]